MNLSYRKYTLIIDKSGSMQTSDAGDGRSRWAAAKEIALALTIKYEKMEGINLYFFADSFQYYHNVNSEELRKKIASINPGGNTDLALVLKDAIEKYFRRKVRDKTNLIGESIFIITDGESDSESITRVLNEAASRITTKKELKFNFFQVGHDSQATTFLKKLNKRMQSYGVVSNTHDLELFGWEGLSSYSWSTSFSNDILKQNKFSTKPKFGCFLNLLILTIGFIIIFLVVSNCFFMPRSLCLFIQNNNPLSPVKLKLYFTKGTIEVYENSQEKYIRIYGDSDSDDRNIKAKFLIDKIILPKQILNNKNEANNLGYLAKGSVEVYKNGEVSRHDFNLRVRLTYINKILKYEFIGQGANFKVVLYSHQHSNIDVIEKGEIDGNIEDIKDNLSAEIKISRLSHKMSQDAFISVSTPLQERQPPQGKANTCEGSKYYGKIVRLTNSAGITITVEVIAGTYQCESSGSFPELQLNSLDAQKLWGGSNLPEFQKVLIDDTLR